ncbi:MAG TPA: GyrI-like domain-containing protein [Streptosporangiaceae bacterium]|jgi:effector-binding domain-containing protein|nr:GyrI-like domain-containing protein [Streptosporangiaceae bacterium]
MPGNGAVRVEHVATRPLAAARTTTSRQRLSASIRELLDQVWPVLRSQGVRTGHNVVSYYPSGAGELTIEAGVETLSDFRATGAVQPAATPSGEVATVAYYGEYSGLGTAYQALERWCADNHRQPAGINWEVYGDWAENPAELRTDVYFLLAPSEGS